MKTPNNSEQKVNTYTPGEEIFSWTAHDYHPHERGTIWMIMFCSVLGGAAAWSIYSDPQWGWVAAVTMLLFAAAYFWIHRNGHEDHEIRCFQRGILIDNTRYIKWIDFEGFWFVYDQSVSVINLEYNGDKGRKLTLQMSENDPEFFRQNLENIEIKELEEKRESLMDLWIRALKL